MHLPVPTCPPAWLFTVAMSIVVSGWHACPLAAQLAPLPSTGLVPQQSDPAKAPPPASTDSTPIVEDQPGGSPLLPLPTAAPATPADLAALAIGTPLEPAGISDPSPPTRAWFEGSCVPPVVAWPRPDISPNLLTTEDLQRFIQELPLRDVNTAGTAATPPADRLIPLASPLIVDPALAPAAFQDPQEPAPTGEVAPPATQEPTPQETVPETLQPQQKIDQLKALIESRKVMITENEALDESSKNELFMQLNSASNWIQKAASSLAYLTTETAARDQFESKLSAAQEKLKQKPEPAKPDPARSLEQLQATLQSKQQALAALSNDQKDNRNRIADRDKRLSLLPNLRSDAAENLKKTNRGLSELASQPEGATKATSELILKSRLLATEIEIQALDLEVQRQEQIGRLLPVERDLLAQDIKTLETEIKAWREAADLQREREIRIQQQNAAAASQREMISSNPVLAGLAKRNEELVQERGQLTSRIEALRNELTTIKSQNESAELSQDNLEKKIDAIGLTPTTGMLLIEHRRSLPSTAKSQSRLPELANKLRDSQSSALSLKEERQLLASTEDYVDGVIQTKAFDNVDADTAAEITRDLVTTQLKYIDDLTQDYDRYRDELSKVDAQHRKLIDTIQDSREYVDDNALWVRSARPISMADLEKSRQGLQLFFSRRGWSELLGTLQNHFTSRPYEAGLLGLLLGGLFMLNRRLKASPDVD